MDRGKKTALGKNKRQVPCYGYLETVGAVKKEEENSFPSWATKRVTWDTNDLKTRTGGGV